MSSTHISHDYYSGFEGEPEISFSRILFGKERILFRLWGGYFETFMNALFEKYRAIDPDNWPLILRHWNELTGYASLEQLPWQIEDLSRTVDAFGTLRKADLESYTSTELAESSWTVLCALIEFLRAALEARETVEVAEDFV